MGSAIIMGLIKHGVYDASDIIATHHDVDKIRLIQNTLAVKAIVSNSEAVKLSKIVFICVKPQDVGTVLEEIKDALNQNNIIISLVAAVPIQMLRLLMDNCGDIYNVHPSSLIITGSPGISYIVCEKNSNNPNLEHVKFIFEAFGGSLVVPERMLNKYAVFAGCSPAFFALFANKWKSLAEVNGIDSGHANEIIANIFRGIAHGLTHRNMTLDEIINDIATPGGITESGLEILNSEALESLYSEVVNRCLRKFQEIIWT